MLQGRRHLHLIGSWTFWTFFPHKRHVLRGLQRIPCPLGYGGTMEEIFGTRFIDNESKAFIREEFDDDTGESI